MNQQHIIDYETAYTQLYLYEQTPEEKLREEIKLLRDSMHRVRKGQYAKIGALMKMYSELNHELEVLKSAMCRK